MPKFLILIFLQGLVTFCCSIAQAQQVPYSPKYVPYRWELTGGNSYYNDWGGQADISKIFTCRVILNNDSIFVRSLKIELDSATHYIDISSGKKNKILVPTATKSISRVINKDKLMVGIPADTCWLFKITTGKINAYSFLPRNNPQHTIAIQQGDGPILPLNAENFLSMVNPELRPKLKPYAEFKHKYKRLYELIEAYNKDKVKIPKYKL